jgi:hypothetical protein
MKYFKLPVRCLLTNGVKIIGLVLMAGMGLFYLNFTASRFVVKLNDFPSLYTTRLIRSSKVLFVETKDELEKLMGKKIINNIERLCIDILSYYEGRLIIERDKAFISVLDRYRLKNEDFDLLIDNLVRIKEIIADWKMKREGALENYILNNTNSSFLKIDRVSFDGEILKFKIADCINIEIDTKNLQIISQEGLSFLPESDYYYEKEMAMWQTMVGLAERMSNPGDMWLLYFYDSELPIAKMSEELWLTEHTIIELLTDPVDKGFIIRPQKEKEELFIEVDEKQLLQEEFSSLDEDENITNKLNRWSYAAFGSTALGRVDKEVNIEEANSKKSAEQFYNNTLKPLIDEDGQLTKEIVIQEWGAGDHYSAKAFLDMIKKLDEENHTRCLDKLKYILIDYSPKVVQDLRESPALKEYKDIVEIRIGDVLDMGDDLPKAQLIRARFLLSSLPKKMIWIKDGKFYELTTRAYIDMDESDTFLAEDGRRYSLDELKEIIHKEDIEVMKKLGRRFFNKIKWQSRYEEIKNIEQFPYSEYLIYLRDKGFKGKISLDIGALEALKNMINNLVEGGQIQITDAGTLEYEQLDEFVGSIVRVFGAVYSPVNFHFLNYMLSASFNYEHQAEYGNEYLEGEIDSHDAMNIYFIHP